MVCLVQWFLTVQQFYPKIVKCLGPLDQADVFFVAENAGGGSSSLCLYLIKLILEVNAVDCVAMVISGDRAT